MNQELQNAMKQHRIVRGIVYDYHREYVREWGTDDCPMIWGNHLDDAHLDHWYALQRAGIPATRAGELCAAITRTRLPR